MIKVQNHTATREPIPEFLRGLAPESLLDLSWTDPQLGVNDAAWWPERDETPELGPDQTFDGTETLTIGDGVVIVARGIRDMTPAELRDRWLAEHPVPASCQRRQGRLALLMQGQLDQVESHIESISDPMEKKAAQIEYEADTWERDNTLLQQMWANLGGTPDGLDDMFRLAVTL